MTRWRWFFKYPGDFYFRWRASGRSPGLLPHAQKLWIDELVIATARVGPLRDK